MLENAYCMEIIAVSIRIIMTSRKNDYDVKEVGLDVMDGEWFTYVNYARSSTKYNHR